MIYRNFQELLDAMLSVMDRHNCDDLAMFAERLSWDAEYLRLKGLSQVYNDAERNPPKGVIGVGAISYAEFILQEAQK